MQPVGSPYSTVLQIEQNKQEKKKKVFWWKLLDRNNDVFITRKE